MSQTQEKPRDEIPAEVSFKGGVRGRQFARHRKITEATGSITVFAVSSVGQERVAIIMEPQRFHDVTAPNLRSGRQSAIAPEDATAIANAV